ncbi:MAG: IS110 family transposase [Phycisphaeraceae bacterium]
MRIILAIDLGKFKSVACIYNTADASHEFRTIRTTPPEVHDLIVRTLSDGEGNFRGRVVIEVGSAAGWVKDICEVLGVEIQIANPNHEAWRWRNIKRKTDKDDGLKMAKLSAMDQLPMVTLPSSQVRQWRNLIAYRHTLVGRRTAIKNNIRAILDRQGLSHAAGKSGWTLGAIERLREMSAVLEDVAADQLWRGMLHVELLALEQIEGLIEPVEAKLEAMARQDARVALLRTIPGVGPRLAETVVAMIDDPKRFKTGKQVGAYAGLVPRQIESGTMSRTGRITGHGNKLLRGLLVEVSWLMRRYNPRLSAHFEQVCRGSKTRKKIAVVATARKLLVICWAMLRDGTRWREPILPGATPGAATVMPT